MDGTGGRPGGDAGGAGSIRRQTEERERQVLSPHAQLAAESRGRDVEVEPCAIRTVFQRDRDRIIHSKAFRRLKGKTQVFLAPRGDHYRTRLTHTLEVAQIARTIARSLRLNEDLTEAIALGHDLGHTPFGHAGEEALDGLLPGGFRHYDQSVRVVEYLEREGEGLNLTWEVRNGVANHTGSREAATLEGHICRLADRIAYVNHDLDDALRAGEITEEDVPNRCLEVLGRSHGERIDVLVRDVITTSQGQPYVRMSDAIWEAMDALRDWLFERVYESDNALKQDKKAERLLERMYEYYRQRPEEMYEGGGIPDSRFFRTHDLSDEERVHWAVRDFLSGMTDRYAIRRYTELFVPSPRT